MSYTLSTVASMISFLFNTFGIVAIQTFIDVSNNLPNVHLQPLHNPHKLRHCLCSVQPSIVLIEHHEIRISPHASEGFPLLAQRQLCAAVAVVAVITLGFNQHDIAFLRHDDEVGIMVDESVEAESMPFYVAMSPFHVLQSGDGENDLLLQTVY